MYDMKSLVTWDDSIFLTYDLITKEYVIGKVLMVEGLIEIDTAFKLVFSSELADSLNEFDKLIRP